MWEDLFEYLFSQPNVTIKLRSAAKGNSSPDDYITLADLDAPIPLRANGSAFYSAFFPAGMIGDDFGSAYTQEYTNDEGELEWSNEAIYFYVSIPAGFNLVGKKVRVRVTPFGNPDEGVIANLAGLGSTGFVYLGSGGHNVMHPMMEFNTSNTGEVGVPLAWHEKTILAGDIIDDVSNGQFVGLGSIGVIPDAPPPEFGRAIYEWQIWVGDDPVDPPDDTVLPWWMCPPKEPVPACPVRPTGYVALSDYDKDFKYPLSSSRIPAKNPRPVECVACRPTLISVSAPPSGPSGPGNPGGGSSGDGDGEG